jgi:hypothetical protein
MSTTLFFLVPIGMLAVVWSVCFVGCVFHTSGLASPYSDDIVGTTGLVAYWPLSDLLTPLNMTSQTSVAQDISGNGHNGTYTIPPAYPTTPANSAVPPNPSVARATSIVPGDAGSTKNPLPASVNFQGGYVSIPWAANSPVLTDFTLEAWVQPSWQQTGFRWSVFSARGPGNTTGFILYVNEQNIWQLFIGTGATTNTTIDTMVAAPVNPSSTTYVALTFQSTMGSTNGTLSLWINPSTDDESNPPTAAFTTQTAYVPIDPSLMLSFFIGADANDVALRTQDGGSGAPLYPFEGQIQSVALYSVALSATDLAGHFENGAAS